MKTQSKNPPNTSDLQQSRFFVRICLLLKCVTFLLFSLCRKPNEKITGAHCDMSKENYHFYSLRRKESKWGFVSDSVWNSKQRRNEGLTYSTSIFQKVRDSFLSTVPKFYYYCNWKGLCKYYFLFLNRFVQFSNFITFIIGDELTLQIRVCP